MGFSSYDDLVKKASESEGYCRYDGAKNVMNITNGNGWHLLSQWTGIPAAVTFPGGDLIWRNCDAFSGDGVSKIGIEHGGAVAPKTKHLLSIAANIGASAGGGSPWVLRLVDLQGYYRLQNGSSTTGTGSRTLVSSGTFTASSSSGLLLTYTNDWQSGTKVRFTTTTTLPTGLSLNTDYWLIRVSATTARVATTYANYVAATAIAYTDGGTGTHTLTIQMPRYDFGVGCEAFFVSMSLSPSGGGPNLTASDYTNTAGTSARAFQGTPSMAASAEAYITRIPHCGVQVGRYGPFLPKQGGDTGIARINSFTWSGGTPYSVLEAALCVVKPLADIPILGNNLATRRDFATQFVSLPRIYDGACLQLMFCANQNSTQNIITYSLEFGWG